MKYKRECGILTDNKSNANENQNQNQNTSVDRTIGATAVKNPRGNIHCLTIIGQIEGHIVLPPQNKATKYEHIIPQLVAIEEDEKIDGLI